MIKYYKNAREMFENYKMPVEIIESEFTRKKFILEILNKKENIVVSKKD